jgi:hypothetical protein
MKYFTFLFALVISANLLAQPKLSAESSLRTEGQNCCNPERTFFQNDWDGNDRDNRYVARDWEKYNLGRFATPLTDPKNYESTPACVSVRTFEEGGRLVAAATLKGTGRSHHGRGFRPDACLGKRSDETRWRLKQNSGHRP